MICGKYQVVDVYIPDFFMSGTIHIFICKPPPAKAGIIKRHPDLGYLGCRLTAVDYLMHRLEILLNKPPLTCPAD